MGRRTVSLLVVLSYAALVAVSGPHAHPRHSPVHGGGPHVHLGWWLPEGACGAHAACAHHATDPVHHASPPADSAGSDCVMAGLPCSVPEGTCCDCVPLPDLAPRAAGEAAWNAAGQPDERAPPGDASWREALARGSDWQAGAVERSLCAVDPPSAAHRLLWKLRNLRL